jgi:hypothetical protein
MKVLSHNFETLEYIWSMTDDRLTALFAEDWHSRECLNTQHLAKEHVIINPFFLPDSHRFTPRTSAAQASLPSGDVKSVRVKMSSFRS